MLSLRNRFGIPGVISVIALVFAMLGGAYAASNESGSGNATASAKRGKPGPPGKRGKPGPPGPAGPVGAKGDKGDTGAAGSNGSNGAVGPIGPAGKTGATGPAGKTGATGPAGKTGATGLSGFVEALPSEETMTGTWWFQGNGNAVQAAPISFPIRLSSAAAAQTKDVYFSHSAEPEKFEQECPGSLANPDAEPGVLCFYVNGESNFAPLEPVAYQPDFATGVEESGVGTSGVLLFFESVAASKIGGGTYAVTAP